MASLYKQRYTKKIPDGAEIFTVNGQQKVRVIGKGGRVKTYDYVIGRDGQPRMAGYSGTWMISYLDLDGIRHTHTTGCKDKAAARQMLARIEQQLEQVKSGMLSKRDLIMLQERDAPIADHFEDYMQHIEVKTIRGRAMSSKHKHGIRQRLGQLIEDCLIETLEDITPETLENWMLNAKDQGRSPRTINSYRAAIVSFCNWAVQYKRLSSNPLAKMFKADESADVRHARRALTKDEVHRLLTAAELRPVAEFGRPSKKLPKVKSKRSNWQKVELNWENLKECYDRGLEVLAKNKNNLDEDQLEKYRRVGRYRKLAYRVLLTTGLRRNELKAVTPDRLNFLNNAPTLSLPATVTKNGKSATIPLRPEIAAELKAMIKELQLFPTDQVFSPVPEINVFDRDLAAASISKRDERNRVVDIHALRHTFGTHLALAGVAPRTAMAAMRHSKIDLTMNIYTDPALLDVAGAVNYLPSF